MRKTSKSKLFQIIVSRSNEDRRPEAKKENTVLIIDLMAMIRVVTEIPETFEDFTLKLIYLLPKGYSRVDIVADC